MFIPYLGYVVGPLVGGFVATYFAKEKRIIYGLFVGIGAIIVLFIYSSSEPTSNLDILKYIIGSIPISIIPAIIGSYIGKRTKNLL
jgi:putative membrane protein (TIGR04086 family)